MSKVTTNALYSYSAVLLDQPGIKLKQICYTVCHSSIHTSIVLYVAFACSVWTAGLRSYVSSEKQLVGADWQLIALWFNLVRDFQKCCVHSDLEIGAPCSLCVQNFNAPKKGDKGPPWWCHYPVSKQALTAGEGAGQDPPPWPQHFTLTPPISDLKAYICPQKFKSPQMICICHVSYDMCHSSKLPVVFSYHQYYESAAAHLDRFLELLYLSGQCPHVTDCLCACDTCCSRLCSSTYISMWVTNCVWPACKDTNHMLPNSCPYSPSLDFYRCRKKTFS